MSPNKVDRVQVMKECRVLTVIRLFLRAVVWKGGPPMDVQRPNPITLAAVRAAKSGKVTNVTFDDL